MGEGCLVIDTPELLGTPARKYVINKQYIVSVQVFERGDVVVYMTDGQFVRFSGNAARETTKQLGILL